MLFPTLKGQCFGYVNLDLFAQTWVPSNFGQGQPPTLPEKNPLLEWQTCARMVEACCVERSLDWWYGGWMENRGFLWRRSYLDKKKTFLHLGVDFSVPAGTAVAIDYQSVVLAVDHDPDMDGGWGGRVVVKVRKTPILLIFAHLQKVVSELCEVNQILSMGRVFANVGNRHENGNWWPHLHVQAVREEYFASLGSIEALFKEVDGYGRQEDIKELASRFPDPLAYVRLR